MNRRRLIVLGFAAGLAVSVLVGGVLKPSGSGATASGARLPRDHGPRRPADLSFGGVEEAATRAARLDALFQDKDKSAWRTEISRWGRDDPAAAWDQVWRTASLPWLRAHPGVLLGLAREWAPRDPAALEAALLNVPLGFYEPGRLKTSLVGGADNRPLLARLLVTLARVEPAAALDVAQQKSGALVEYTSVFLREFSAESPTEAARLAASLPPGEARDRSVINVANRWAASDPSASLAFAQANLAPRQYRTVLDESLKRLVDVDPAALAPALVALPPGQYRAGWIERVTSQWMGADREACTAWIESLPAGPDRELALHKSAVAIADSDPREAIEMARSLTSTGRQRAVVFAALSSWAKTDAYAANAYAHSLPDDQTRVDALKLLQPPAAAPLPAAPFAPASDFQFSPLWETLTPAAERKMPWDASLSPPNAQ